MTALLCIVFTQAVFASAALQDIRFSNNALRTRVVYEAAVLPKYELSYSSDGRQVKLLLFDVSAAALPEQFAVNDTVVSDVKVQEVPRGVQTTIRLNRSVKDGIRVEVNRLTAPNRLYIDVLKTFEQKSVEKIQAGLTYTKFLRQNGQGALTAHFLEIDPKSGLVVKPMLAQDKIIGRESLSAMAARSKAVAAVNSSYFSASGELLGFTKIDGEIVSTTYLKRGALGITPDETFFTGQVAYSGTVKTKDKTIYLSGVNCERGVDAAVLYNKFFGASTGTNIYGREYVVKNGVVIGIYSHNAPLYDGEQVISVHGASAAALADVNIGDFMQIDNQVGSLWQNAECAVGVGPLLVRKGRIDLTTRDEQFGADVALGRAPRTAAGITARGTLLLGVVDGRQQHSIGCTLTELAELMREFGAVDAVNFDGGGSSEMIIRNKIINKPSDGRERAIGAGLGVFAR